MRNVIAGILLCVGVVARPVFCQGLLNSAPTVVADSVSVELPPTPGIEALTGSLQTPPAVSLQQPAVHPVAVDYGHAYDVRAKIHKYASYSMLPMFGAQVVVGQKLRNELDSGEDTHGGLKTAHTALATGIVGLFAVNSVTGVWNLVQSRNDQNQRGLRLAHSLMMLGADAGFVATAMITPNEHEHGGPFSNGPHRTIALTSMGVATASYLIMLIGNR
jgi:hypothetical protein